MDPTRPGTRRLRNSCDICTLSKLKCSREKPVCQRCVDRGCQQDCNYSVARRPGRRRQTSIVSDDVGSYGQDASANGLRKRRGTAPLTPSSSSMDSLFSTKKRHDSTRNTPQQISRETSDGGDGRMLMRSPGMDLMESFTNIPMELSHSGDGVDFEPMESLSLWEWGESGIDINATNSHHPGVMPQMWNMSSGQTMLSGMDFDLSNGTGGPGQEPSPPLSHTSQRNLFQDNQTSLLPPADFSKDSSSSSPAASNFIFDLSKNVDCKCSTQLSQLMYSVSLWRATAVPLDVVFAVEQQLSQTKEAITGCAHCSLGSIYTSMMLCTAMSWVIEHLEAYMREATTVSAPNGQTTYLTISGLTLSKDMSQSCSEALVKLRLRRVVQTSRELSMFNMETKSTLLGGLRSAAAETGAAAQQMFGMLEMRGAF